MAGGSGYPQREIKENQKITWQNRNLLKSFALSPGQNIWPWQCWKNFTLKDKKMSDAGVLEKFRAILNGIIQFWSPGTIAVEDVFYNQSRKSRLLNTLAKEIENIGKERRLKVYFHSPVAARKFICQDTKPTRMNVARVIAEGCYPGLKKDYEKEKKKTWWKPKDRLRVFDAMAVGLFCLHKLKKKN
jgi:hypothetical protein